MWGSRMGSIVGFQDLLECMELREGSSEVAGILPLL